jgi:hypothetical protein
MCFLMCNDRSKLEVVDDEQIKYSDSKVLDRYIRFLRIVVVILKEESREVLSLKRRLKE